MGDGKSYDMEPRVMSAADVASDYARRMIGKEAGGGSIDSAMNRLEAKTGISYWTWRNLWYGRPKEVSADLFIRLRGTYLALAEREVSKLQHELATEAARGAHDLDADLLAEAQALAAKIKARQAR